MSWRLARLQLPEPCLVALQEGGNYMVVFLLIFILYMILEGDL